MPTYDYECTRCSSRFEVRRSMEDATPVQCPQCQAEAKRVFSAPLVNTWKAKILPPN